MSDNPIDKLLQETLARHPQLDSAVPAIQAAYELLHQCFSASKKLLVGGNGGSAADAEHIVAELMNRFAFHRQLSEQVKNRLTEAGLSEDLTANLQPSLRAISLGSQTALTTAIANDLGYPLVYAQQVLGYGDEGDVLLAISTSGNSANVVNAAKVAKAQGLRVIALTGSHAGDLGELADLVIAVDSSVTSEIQELHLPVYHLLCKMLELAFFSKVG